MNSVDGEIMFVCCHRNPEVKEEMSRWGLAFDRDLLSIQARVLPPEKIRQRGQVVRSLLSVQLFYRSLSRCWVYVAITSINGHSHLESLKWQNSMPIYF